MRYYSTNHNAPKVDFKTATIEGQAPDKGLYFPETIPAIDRSILAGIENISNEAIAYEVIRPYVGNTITAIELKQIVEETVNFSIPLVPVTDRISSLELFHGPTLAFKDIGARFMSRCLSYFLKDENKKVTVLVATSGDTGGAVAQGFYDVPNVNVVILYPAGKISLVQEKQLTTLGKNITALEINGSFDDCQDMVKKAFADGSLTSKMFLTSANSINVARWLPQQFYYFFACKQWKDKARLPVISVPSGNFGNICAGILANASGLPVAHFIAACNANDVVPNFMQTNHYITKKAVSTISNAMDVGNPSNFVRILEIFAAQHKDIRNLLSSVSISDAETKSTIKKVYAAHNYLLDPHGAVAYHALDNYLKEHTREQGFIIETAHPVKFYDVVEPVIGVQVAVPQIVQSQLNLEKKSIRMEADYKCLKEYLAFTTSHTEA